MYICDNIMEVTEEGSSQNILVNVQFVVTIDRFYLILLSILNKKYYNWDYRSLRKTHEEL